MNLEQVLAKWQDYLFLTHEMKKFLVARDFKLFYSLLAQREKLQEEIQSLKADEYYSSVEGKKFLLSIQQDNREMVQQFQLVFNTAKKGQAVSQAYEGLTSFSSNFINRQT